MIFPTARVRHEGKLKTAVRFWSWSILLLCLATVVCLAVLQLRVLAKRPAGEKALRESVVPVRSAPPATPVWDEEDLMPNEWLSQAGSGEPNVLVAQGILLRDADGQDRAELKAFGDRTSLTVLGPDGRTRVVLEALADGSSLHLMDGKGDSRVEIVVRDGSTQLIINDKQNGREFRAP